MKEKKDKIMMIMFWERKLTKMTKAMTINICIKNIWMMICRVNSMDINLKPKVNCVCNKNIGIKNSKNMNKLNKINKFLH